MTTPARGSARSRRHYVTAGLAAMMGTTIEWYDFFLYGTAAALVFNKIFFPAINPLTGTLLLKLRAAGPGESPGDGEAERRWREASATPGEALREIGRALRQRAGALDAQILIPIDQAEELFTRAAPSDRRAFFAW